MPSRSSLQERFKKPAPANIEAVIWLTAKRSEFVERHAIERAPDFDDISSFCRGVWEELYGEAPQQNAGPDEAEQLVDELNKTRCLIIVDDLDTVLDDIDTTDFLLHGLRACKSKILYTSRQRIPGLTHIEVPGF